MLNQLKPGFLMMVVMTVLTGLIYPGIVTAIAQVLFRDQANGSLVVSNGQVVGSHLIGQSFAKPEYFHPRPSSAGGGYDPTASAGSNLGPTSAKLMNGTTKVDDKKNEVVDFDGVEDRIVHYCLDNDIPYESSVPLDTFKDTHGDLDDVKLIKAFNDDKAPLVFTPKMTAILGRCGEQPRRSAPRPLDISPANADVQAVRVAKVRGIPAQQVRDLVARHTEGRDLGFLGEPRVNVLAVNMGFLDAAFPQEVRSIRRPCSATSRPPERAASGRPRPR